VLDHAYQHLFASWTVPPPQTGQIMPAIIASALEAQGLRADLVEGGKLLYAYLPPPDEVSAPE